MKFVLEHDETECDTIELRRTNLATAIYQVTEFISAFARHGESVTWEAVFQNDVPEGIPTLGDYLLNYEVALSNIHWALSTRLKKQSNVSRAMRKTAYKVLSDSKLSKSEIKAALKVIGYLMETADTTAPKNNG